MTNVRERLTKTADALIVKGRMRRRRKLILMWEDCVKRNLVGLGREMRQRTSYRLSDWGRAA